MGVNQKCKIEILLHFMMRTRYGALLTPFFSGFVNILASL
ncbi:hypothetical protein D1AOALGA4SA_1142 [Olavius algarvensis Delta 1 endosymbiont]|nr:hypothetical protein D1AOALGA4SA_1142 [Olavius algarvensis Delta 1 endosymbiont]